ncbi:hypothetical protein HDV03_001174 [Kappamyces sp. JEL0829]|nr:hypothetical protein HDV03_001174 [Kappamyces sp. JEL0829]
MKLTKSFTIDGSVLKKRFREWQSKWHPDLFGSKSPIEQQMSAEMSMMANKAYQILRDPLSRAHYLLELSNKAIPDNFALPPSFLMQVMDIQERVDDASIPKELEALVLENQQRIDATVSAIAAAFEADDLKAAQLETVKLNYWYTIARLLHEKLE